MQTQAEPVTIGQLIRDCDTEMHLAFRLMGQMLIGTTDKREILAAFETFEEGYNACANLAARGLKLAIDGDPGAAALARASSPGRQCELRCFAG